MLSSRGAFIAIGGILLISVGLSAKGIGTLTTMLPILSGEEGWETEPLIPLIPRIKHSRSQIYSNHLRF